MRILLVEDDAVIGERLQTALQKAGYRVDLAHDGDKGLDLALFEPYGLMIFDIMLPKRDGWQIVEEVRNNRITTPILMLTARDAVEDRVKGLETGADDYLPKPFDFRELLARVQALVRRDRLHRSRTVKVADLELDVVSRQATRAGDPIKLTRHEYDLLEALAQNEGRTLTREVILDRIWGDSESISNVVDHHIASLRKKVDAGRLPKLIHTVHGLGYVMKVPE